MDCAVSLSGEKAGCVASPTYTATSHPPEPSRLFHCGSLPHSQPKLTPSSLIDYSCRPQRLWAAMLRRHYLYREQENENSVGDASGSNVLRLWLERRRYILHHEQVMRYVVFFWDLAKPRSVQHLPETNYVSFMQCVAKALLQSADTETARVLAERDWQYDSVGAATLSLEAFQEALFQTAELLLPIEADSSVYVSFFLELRDAITDPETIPSTNDPDSPLVTSQAQVDANSSGSRSLDLTLSPTLNSPQLFDAVTYKLRSIQDVAKIRGAFLQQMPPGSDRLSVIAGLTPPDPATMSLKQVLLAYNPRKFALSRQFSALFSEKNLSIQPNQDTRTISLAIHGGVLPGANSVGDGSSGLPWNTKTSPPWPSIELTKRSEDPWDVEDALIEALQVHPALRVGVVGPPGSGKTRIAKSLAKRLHLQYCSLPTSIENAVETTRQRDRDRQRRIQELQAAAEGSTEEGDADNPKAVLEGTAIHEESDVDEVLSRDDFTTLMDGAVLPRARALSLLENSVRRHLLSGVGVVVDDLHPAEVANSLTLDYLIVLETAQEDVLEHIAGLAMDPSTRCIYSAREQAILTENDSVLRDRGFATLPYQAIDAESGNASTGSTATGDSPATKESIDGKDTQEDAAGDEETDNEMNGEISQLAVKTVLTEAELNEIVPPGDLLVSVRRLLMDAFKDRYQDYTQRVVNASTPTRTHTVHVLAPAQSLDGIVKQCVDAISNNLHGISRNVQSHAAIVVTLPEEIAASENRSDQVRWLLFGDWSESGIEESLRAFEYLPTPHERRLSHWKQCCPVSSSMKAGLVLGSPQFAVCYNARIYLLASEPARLLFLAHPLQYLRVSPQTLPSTRKIWLLSSGPVSAATTATLASSLHCDVVSAVELITSHTDTLSEVELAELQSGKTLPLAKAVGLVVGALHGQTSWILTDLMPSLEVLSALSEHNCLPDLVITLTIGDEDALGKRAKTDPLTKIKYEQWESQFGTDSATLMPLLTQFQLEKACKSSDWYEDSDDQTAAIKRVANLVSPAVDSIGEGTLGSLEEAALVFSPSKFEFESPNDADTTDAGDSADDVGEEPLESSLNITDDHRWLQRRVKMGETAQFCPVSWVAKRLLIPGLPAFISSYEQALYSFAGEEERSAFERCPLRYIPRGPCSTKDGVPVILVIGVRGTDADDISAHLANVCLPRRITVLNRAELESRVRQRQRIQSLQEGGNQTTIQQMYVEELARELKTLTKPDQHDAILLTGLYIKGEGDQGDDSEMGEMAGGDDDRNDGEGGNSPSIPSPDLLDLCYRWDIFPTLVLPLTGKEEVIVSRRLQQWRARQPPLRRKKPRSGISGADGDEADASPEADADGDDDDKNLEQKLAEREAEQRVLLQEQYQSDSEALHTALQHLHGRGITIEKPLRTDTTRRACIKAAAHHVNRFVDRKQSLFEYIQNVTGKAEIRRMLQSGEALIGKHGLLCPFTSEYTTMTTNSELSAVMYRKRLYFPQFREHCESRPSRLVECASQPPQPRPTCCIVGPPSVGKTRLAQAMCLKFNSTLVSPQSAMDWVVQCHGDTALSTKLRHARAAGAQPDTETMHDAIVKRLQSTECQRNGWVLDDYFRSATELQRSLHSAQLVLPAVMVVLEGSFATVWEQQRRKIDPTVPSTELWESLLSRFAGWQRQRLELINSWTTCFGAFHVRQIDSTLSFWHICTQATSAVSESLARTRQYLHQRAMEMPARLYGVLRPLRMLERHLHTDYQRFCPVELTNTRYVSTLVTQRELCVEIDGRVFWLSSESNLLKFCEAPGTFLGSTMLQKLENAQRSGKLLALAPVDASLLSLLSVPDCDFPEMKGYCPVTFKNGTGDKDWHAIVKGSVFLRASYENQVFLFASERARQQFILEPSRFVGQVLPVHLPPQITNAMMARDSLGRLEQELSDVLNESLLRLGRERPKFLRVNGNASACFYIALLLKSRATSLSNEIRAGYEARLQEYASDCRLSGQLLAAMAPSGATSCGPAVKGVRVAREASVGKLAMTDADAAKSNRSRVAALQKRFEEIAAGVDESNSNNSVCVERNREFYAYAVPLTKKTLKMIIPRTAASIDEQQ